MPRLSRRTALKAYGAQCIRCRCVRTTFIISKRRRLTAESERAGAENAQQTSIPKYWASNSSNSGRGDITIRFEVFEYNTDYETTVSGAVLASAEVVGDVDNKDAEFALNNRIPAGDVLAVFSATNSGSVGFYGANSCDLITEVYASGTQIEFYPKMAAKYLVLEETEPEPTTEPQPGTGDGNVALIAVIAVLAIAAVVVILKKKVS